MNGVGIVRIATAGFDHRKQRPGRIFDHCNPAARSDCRGRRVYFAPLGLDAGDSGVEVSNRHASDPLGDIFAGPDRIRVQHAAYQLALMADQQVGIRPAEAEHGSRPLELPAEQLFIETTGLRRRVSQQISPYDLAVVLDVGRSVRDGRQVEVYACTAGEARDQSGTQQSDSGQQMNSPAQPKDEDGDATLLTRIAHRAQHGGMRRARTVAALLIAAAGTATASPLFEDREAIEVVLQGPFAALHEDMGSREQLPFTLSAEGVDHNVKVRLRGKSRLQVCRFPPLRLNFKKSATDDTVFATQDKLKLVVPCNWSGRAHKDLVEEYAAYRIFNLLSDASYRVRLLHALFIDPDDRSLEDKGPRYAFVLEATEALAERFDGEEAEKPEVALWLVRSTATRERLRIPVPDRQYGLVDGDRTGRDRLLP